MNEKNTLYIVIPCYKEQEVLPETSKRLREKMHENTRNPKFIKTVWGVGYKIER